ncbi:MAG: hypothetical protein V2I67_15450 [Thermoanaerobaculales bacterium]|jgi:hypothetical protein|nr:hypothetical protein [Thermoanaerobaculales bacterium]
MVDLERLREAYRTAARSDEDGHPSSADWERLACGELEGEPRRRLLDHVMGCPMCADIYRALDIVRSEAPVFDEGAPRPEKAQTRPARSRWASWRGMGVLAIAATAVLVVVLPLQRGGDSEVEPGIVVRSGNEAGTLRPVAPVGEVRWRPGDDVVLEWAADAPNGPYVVEILDGGGEPVWTGPDTEDTETVWPGDAVPGPGQYYWRVLAGGASSDRDDSPLEAFELVSANPP